jgi:hypothetical protein
MAYKKFSKALHDEFDDAGRQVVKKFLAKKGYEVKDNENKYAVDLVVFKNNKKVAYAEVEIRPAWKGSKFPYEDLNIPYRKKKLLNNTMKTLFFSINNEKTHMFWCDAKTILASKTAFLSNKYVKNEKFFKVQLQDLKYEKI